MKICIRKSKIDRENERRTIKEFPGSLFLVSPNVERFLFKHCVITSSYSDNSIT